jgi:hypothetical protein
MYALMLRAERPIALPHFAPVPVYPPTISQLGMSLYLSTSIQLIGALASTAGRSPIDDRLPIPAQCGQTQALQANSTTSREIDSEGRRITSQQLPRRRM